MLLRHTWAVWWLAAHALQIKGKGLEQLRRCWEQQGNCVRQVRLLKVPLTWSQAHLITGQQHTVSAAATTTAAVVAVTPDADQYSHDRCSHYCCSHICCYWTTQLQKKHLYVNKVSVEQEKRDKRKRTLLCFWFLQFCQYKHYCHLMAASGKKNCHETKTSGRLHDKGSDMTEHLQQIFLESTDQSAFSLFMP